MFNNFFNQYPPPTKIVIDRIAECLYRSPQFYVAVLDVMRNMGFPAPFENCNFCTKIPENNSRNPEIEDQDIEISSNIPATLPDFQDKKRLKSLLIATKKSHLSPPAEGKSKNEIFDSDFPRKRPRISIILDNATLEKTSTNGLPSPTNGFGTFAASTSGAPDTNTTEKPFDFSTAFDLDFIRKNRADEKMRKSCNAFKNYQPGDPSCRLYVKNVSKKATKDDLQRLFAAFVDRDNGAEPAHGFDVCLMTGGKLHGQAFVSFPSQLEAEKALKKCNGFILHGKPLVIMYARSKR